MCESNINGIGEKVGNKENGSSIVLVIYSLSLDGLSIGTLPFDYSKSPRCLKGGELSVRLELK